MGFEKQISIFGVHISINLILVNEGYRKAFLIQGTEDFPTDNYTLKEILLMINILYPKLNFYQTNQGTIITLEQINPEEIKKFNQNNKFIGKIIDYPCYENWNKDLAFEYNYGIHIYVMLKKEYFGQKRFQILGNVCSNNNKFKFIKMAKSYEKCLKEILPDLVNNVFVEVEQIW